ncbi:MAG: anthranilate synthase component I family protein [Anaerolineales bacterium]|nr:anthranilate synthase component I family protein [Anaerolineales bacterium]
MTREQYTAAVRKAKEHIAAGDAFQIIPSQRFSRETTAQPFEIYRTLRRLNPSPYMFFFDFGNLASGQHPEHNNGSILSGVHLPNGGGSPQSKDTVNNGSILSGGSAKSKDADYAQPLYLIGASPEMHVRYSDGIASIRPIAGTRPRGQTPAADRTLEHDLLADPKERAEHVMLVDLARNDLGRVCKYGTVRVSEQMVVERYSHVMHIVSHVDGELRPGLDAFDLVRATFPAGTVSGAPKVRAMQIIRDLEPEPRGIYSGAVGYFGYDGNADTCLAIRTLVMQGQTVHIQAGAGIVADSDPELEYEETVNKAKAIAVAIELAEGGRK